MRTLTSSSSPGLLRRIFLRPTPTTTFLSPLYHTFISNHHPLSISSQTTTTPLPFSHSLSSSSHSLSLSSPTPHSLSLLNSQTQNETEIDEEFEFEENENDPSTPLLNSETQTPIIQEDGGDEIEAQKVKTDELGKPVECKVSNIHRELLMNLQSLSVKEKKDLASYAHSLGKKLKSQQVGKSGVTDSVATALVETLEANELLKLKIHKNCPGELDDVVKQLEVSTGSVVVGRIGRTVIIYRPSLTKLKAEEKKEQAMKVFLKRRAAFKSSLQNRGRSPIPSGRSNRRGIRS